MVLVIRGNFYRVSQKKEWSVVKKNIIDTLSQVDCLLRMKKRRQKLAMYRLGHAMSRRVTVTRHSWRTPVCWGRGRTDTSRTSWWPASRTPGSASGAAQPPAAPAPRLQSEKSLTMITNMEPVCTVISDLQVPDNSLHVFCVALVWSGFNCLNCFVISVSGSKAMAWQRLSPPCCCIPSQVQTTVYRGRRIEARVVSIFWFWCSLMQSWTDETW